MRYNRLGQPKTATDYTGTRTFHYDPAKPWRQTSTTLPAFYGGRTFSLLHAESGVVGRDLGFQLGNSPGSAADLETAYTFTAAGRLETLASKRAANSVSRTFRYGYKANTDLLESLTIDGGHQFSLTRTYHPDLDLVTAVDTQWGGASQARYDYTYNALHQRATAQQSGHLFADYGAPTYHRFTYNARGELTDAPAYLGSDVSSTAQPLPGRQHAYAYDSIGNRQWANRTGNATLKESFFANDTGTTEGANALNQYRSRENDSVPVQGTVDASSTTVAVAGAAATGRQGRYFAAEVAVGNASGPWSGSVVTYAAKVGGGSGGTDLVRASSTDTRIARALQALTYDDDGNLLSDGLWDYQWDAENRLVRMAATALAVTAGYPNKVMEFRYDYQGRRVMKRDANVAGSERRHLFVGWNVVAEFAWEAGTSTLSLSRTFTWGLDLVGSLTASGGVGALLQIRDETQGKTLLPAYDGNGNVTALMDADTGTAAATYEYDPFGRLLRAEGSYAKDNNYRLSTKWHDDETDLVYYGHRYYSPSLGRFINRDPIGEQGGLNLQAFCRNDPVNTYDILGRITPEEARDALEAAGESANLFLGLGGKVTSWHPGTSLAEVSDAEQYDLVLTRAQIEAIAAKSGTGNYYPDGTPMDFAPNSGGVSQYYSPETGHTHYHWGKMNGPPGGWRTHPDPHQVELGQTLGAFTSGLTENLSVVGGSGWRLGPVGSSATLKNPLADGLLGGSGQVNVTTSPRSGFGIGGNYYVGINGGFKSDTPTAGSFTLSAGAGVFARISIGWGRGGLTSVDFTGGLGFGLSGDLQLGASAPVIKVDVSPSGDQTNQGPIPPWD